MAGLGRRTHYRKHLTDSVIHDLPVPQGDERIAKVVATRGGNQFDIILAVADGSSAVDKRKPQLCLLPTKFRKLVFIKRGDFVIVETSVDDELDTSETDEPKVEQGGVRCIVKHILYKDQIRHLKTEGYWPVTDTEFNSMEEISSLTGAPSNQGSQNDNDDGIVYNEHYDEDDEDLEETLFINTNRLAALEVQDSSDSESDG